MERGTSVGVVREDSRRRAPGTCAGRTCPGGRRRARRRRRSRGREGLFLLSCFFGVSQAETNGGNVQPSDVPQHQQPCDQVCRRKRESRWLGGPQPPRPPLLSPPASARTAPLLQSSRICFTSPPLRSPSSARRHRYLDVRAPPLARVGR
jgi:hypothetical protein